ncbi:LRR receptor kinase SERK2-like [Cryptomeria japonica]|uniref:LRR receptor kinase SERK2-like n=1 Tax=Cryptomeria japonica TaxID=3369 RepID=UPI0025ACEB45|nr:LRR receptor kinase SERK2-like [Cryptomeria japonica]
MANWLVFLILLYYPCFIAATNAEGQALLELKAGLNESTDLLGTWDPNLVEPCTSRSHITCSGGHVTAVHLESMGFSGTLSPDIGELTGEIPSSIKKISTLIEVDLSFNDLTGQIPEALFQRPEYNFSGNKLNYGSNLQHPCASTLNSNSGGSKSIVGVLIGSIGGTVVVLTCFIFLLWKCWWLRYRKEDVSGEDDRKISFGQLKRFSWHELQLATDDFSEKIGQEMFEGGPSNRYEHPQVLAERRAKCKKQTQHATFLADMYPKCEKTDTTR